MKLAKFWWLLLLSSHCFGAKEIELSRESSVEAGVHFQILLPNILTGFPKSLGVYGPHVGFPFGAESVQIQAFYGKSEEQSAILGEASFRHNFRTPFFTAHAQAGPHYLATKFGPDEKGHIGGHLGFGFDVPFSKTFVIGVAAKLYVQERHMLAFGGGFGIFL